MDFLGAELMRLGEGKFDFGGGGAIATSVI